MMRHRFFRVLTIAAVLLAPVFLRATWQEDQEVARAIGLLREVRGLSQVKDAKQFRAKMDAAWEQLLKHRARSIETIHRLLREERGKTKQNELFLCEGARFLIANERPLIDDVAFEALDQVQDHEDTICHHRTLLGNSIYKALVDGAHDERLFDVIDKFFLLTPHPVEVFLNGYPKKLDAVQTCVYLYGAFSPDGQWRVSRLLNQHVKASKRILRILSVIGTKYCRDAVERYVRYGTDPEGLELALDCLLKNCGPQGRAFILGMDTHRLDAKQMGVYRRIRAEAEKVSYNSLRLEITGGKGTAIADAEVTAQLRKGRETDGREFQLAPAALFQSTLPSTKLINQLIWIRNGSFRHPAESVIPKARAINRDINTLRYRALEWHEDQYASE